MLIMSLTHGYSERPNNSVYCAIELPIQCYLLTQSEDLMALNSVVSHVEMK